MVRRLLCIIIVCLCINNVYAQADVQSFRSAQWSSARVTDAWKKYDDTLASTFRRKGLAWPATDIYIRAFKSQNELELWARNSAAAEYKLVKTYKICAVSGSLGPKHLQGDRQIPEGFYFIDEYNPKSDYLLSLHVSYPNYVDEVHGKGRLGGDIYIHGGCVTVGCLPMTNPGIEEIYTACLNARLNGQEYVPVHIYPTKLNRTGLNYLMTQYAGNLDKQQFWAGMKGSYDYFERTHRLLPVMYGTDGNYVN